MKFRSAIKAHWKSVSIAFGSLATKAVATPRFTTGNSSGSESSASFQPAPQKVGQVFDLTPDQVEDLTYFKWQAGSLRYFRRLVSSLQFRGRPWMNAIT